MEKKPLPDILHNVRPKPNCNKDFSLGDLVYTYIGDYPAQIINFAPGTEQKEFTIRYAVFNGQLWQTIVKRFEIYIPKPFINPDNE